MSLSIYFSSSFLQPQNANFILLVDLAKRPMVICDHLFIFSLTLSLSWIYLYPIHDIFYNDKPELQSILKEISPGCSLEGQMLKLKLQYFGYLMQRADSLEKILMWERFRAGGEGDNRGWDGWMASPTQWTWVWVNSGSWWWPGRPGVLRFMGSQRVGHDWVTELDWYSRFCVF